MTLRDASDSEREVARLNVLYAVRHREYTADRRASQVHVFAVRECVERGWLVIAGGEPQVTQEGERHLHNERRAAGLPPL